MVPLLRQFAIQTAFWGVVVFAVAYRGWQHLGLREYAGLTEMVNLLWLNLGLFVGCIAVGITLLIAGLRWGPRPAAMGAGIGVVVQGITLAFLELRFIDLIGPIR